MKRFMIAVVIAGVLFSAGLSFAQDKDAPQMPEKVRAFLDNLVGTWDLNTEPFQVTVTIEWDRGKNFLIGLAEGRKGNEPYSDAVFWHWDGISEDRVAMYWVAPDTHTSAKCKILSKTLMAGEETGIQAGQTLKNTFQVESDSPDRFVIRNTKTTRGGETQPDWTGVFTRIKGVTPKDFEEFCNLFKGRWACKMTLFRDTPGFGVKGDTFTAYFDSTLSENGHYITSQTHYGKGWQTQLKYYDPIARAIKTTIAHSSGAMSYATDRKVPGGWRTHMVQIGADGTKEGELILDHIFSKDGKTWTVKVSTPGDESNILVTYVWHRLSK